MCGDPRGAACVDSDIVNVTAAAAAAVCSVQTSDEMPHA